MPTSEPIAPKPKESSFSPVWLGIFLLALAVRSLFLVYWEKNNIEAGLGSDGYVTLAQYWGGWLPSVTDRILFNTGPGFAFFCTILFKLAGAPHLMVVRVANVILSSATCLIAGTYAHRVAGPGPALMTAFLMAVSPTLIFLTPHLQSESFFLFFYMLFFYALSRWPDVSKPQAWTHGLFAGLLTLIRSAFASALPFLAAALMLQRFKLKRLAVVGLFAFGAMLPPLAWGIRNKVVIGKFIPLTVQTGLAFYMGLQTNTADRQPYMNAAWAEIERHGITQWIEKDRYLQEKAFAFIRSHPSDYAKIVFVKFFQFWRPWPYPPYPLVARVGLGVYYSVIFLLAGIGVWTVRGDLRPYLPMFSVFISLSFAHSLMDSSLRYRVPVEPFLCVLASVGALSLRKSTGVR